MSTVPPVIETTTETMNVQTMQTKKGNNMIFPTKP